MAELRDYFAAHAGAPMPSASPSRRRPGEAVLAPVAAPASGDRTTRAIRALFAPNGLCSDCHAIVPPSRPGALDYKIAPVTLPQTFLTKGFFDHKAHATEACATCHQAARSTSTRDLLVPGIATCRQCHVGEHGGSGARQVASTCAMCHVFHDDSERAATADRRQPYRSRMATAELGRAALP